MFMIHRTKRRAMARVSRQHGMSLIESLVALLVLALGIMGLAGVQARMLAENRTTNSRAIAVSLIEDLANRMQLNRDAALGALDAVFLAGATILPAAVDCSSATCTPAQMAQSDLNTWRTAMRALLGPGGNSAVFRPAPPLDSNQIGIMIAWTANEGKDGSGGIRDTTVFNVTSGTATVCPVDSICHLVYVRP
ncbi:MAG: type IV pilus modification protein PilV [Rhodoferax sp.]|nr:type IV pilus modification protein PilV [Rhodoferax sp.]